MKDTKRCFGSLVTLIAVGLLLAGCETKHPRRASGKTVVTAKSHDHDHASEGPHGGALVELGGGEYHAEFTVDHGQKKATVYVLDGSAKKSAPIQAATITLTITNVKPPLQFELKPDPQADDPKGSSSRFSGTHDKLGTEMEFKGEVSAKIGDKPYTGTFEEKEHDHK